MHYIDVTIVKFVSEYYDITFVQFKCLAAGSQLSMTT